MNTRFEIAIIVGSLRKGSFTNKVAHALVKNAPASMHCTFIEIGGLPLYNEDLEDKVPAWKRFRAQIAASDAVLFLTPEYNRSISACIKNAMDVGSRPQNKSVWDAKPAGVVSVTPYKMGAFGANHILRQSLVYLNMPVMQQPEAYIGDAGTLFGRGNKLKDAKTKKRLADFMGAWEQWITRFIPDAESGGFTEFMRTREKAAVAYVNGNHAPLDAIIAQEGPATFFHPNGGAVTGAGRVATRYDSDAKAFSPKGTSHFEVLQSGASGDIAFWTGFQPARVKIGGKTIPMKLRITELFRLVDGEWKLVHRHADPAAKPQKKPKS
jgi:NAD(P)H-dependent FMN reductase/ketosteroid isomerase-like protein